MPDSFKSLEKKSNGELKRQLEEAKRDWKKLELIIIVLVYSGVTGSIHDSLLPRFEFGSIFAQFFCTPFPGCP